MKLSRRCFLSFVVGGAAGTALSPLPWKLMDDSSIWSQNWSWTPVPPDGAASYTQTTCTLCRGGCGIAVRKIDDRAVKIEGTAGYPVNDGGICMLGLSGLQMLYGPTRVKAPMKRVGERGAGKWKTITWEQAVEEVSEKLAAIRKGGKPQSVACLASREDGTVPKLLARLMTAYGSPNFMCLGSAEDAYRAVMNMTQGATGAAGVDVENADFIVSFGCAILDGYGSPVRMIQANSRWKEKKAVLVQVEPRLSNTAAKSDQWLAVKPGSEADLALSMAYVIIAKGLYNRSFIDNYCEGFEAFAKMVEEKYAPDAVAGRIGVGADTIVELARRFAKADKPLALYGRGKGQVPGSLKEALAVHALNALVGNINRAGGVYAIPAFDYINWPEIAADGIAEEGLKHLRIDGAGTDPYSQSRHLPHRFFEAVNEGGQTVEALLVAGTNPCHELPDADAVKTAIGKIPFVVSFSSFMDETAMNADLILPDHVYLERHEDVPVSAGLTVGLVGLCKPVVSPQFNTQHLGDTILQIAKALEDGIAESFPWDDYETCLQETLADQWDDMLETGYWRAQETPASEWETAFDTSSGKFTLMDDSLGAIYLSASPLPEGDASGFPFILLPYDSIRLASRQVGDPPFMMKTVSDTVLKGQDGLVEINRQKAEQLGFTEGQAAVLKTPKGEVSVRVHLSDQIGPEIIAMPRGLGHSAYDEYLAGKGVNVNKLIGPVQDPASGLDAAWGIRAQLAKA